MMESGIYYGIREQHQLVAVAGTHVVSRASRVAAIGNVYTASHARGCGYATRTTAAVARALFHQGCECVILNVNMENRPAIRVYERLGFRTHVEFWEAPGAVRLSAG
jgi:predicted GNAT family acetyltransferase